MHAEVRGCLDLADERAKLPLTSQADPEAAAALVLLAGHYRRLASAARYAMETIAAIEEKVARKAAEPVEPELERLRRLAG